MIEEVQSNSLKGDHLLTPSKADRMNCEGEKFSADYKGDSKRGKLLKWPRSLSATDSSSLRGPMMASPAHRPQRHTAGISGWGKELVEGAEKCLQLRSGVACIHRCGRSEMSTNQKGIEGCTASSNPHHLSA